MKYKYGILWDNAKTRKEIGDFSAWQAKLKARLEEERLIKESLPPTFYTKQWVINMLEYNQYLKEDDVVTIYVEEAVPCTTPEEIEFYGATRDSLVRNIIINQSDLSDGEVERLVKLFE